MNRIREFIRSELMIMIPTFNPVTPGFHVSFVDFLDAAAAGGFPAIDYYIPPFAKVAREQSVEEAKQLLTSRGLELGVFGLPVEFRKDEETFQAELKQLPALAELARELGSTRCCTWLLPSTDEPVAEYTSRFIRRLRECAKLLNHYDITFGLEWVGPKTSRTMKHEFIHTLPGMLELAAAIDQPNVGVLFDSFHWFTSHATIDDILSLTPDQIVLVHINDAPDKPADEQIDNERLLPGEGIIDLTGMLNALRTIGYDSYVSVETFSAELPKLDPKTVAVRTKAALDSVFAKIN
ncbi:sugar phosphate isomerase/epimerase family protein [Paenibacillus thermotolerans]|uniref:sugar phosphate isomerase/epimerase family protein n=1 Tax=Paenibacillus thermotolerans TaxID=3027807 RepID=UPI0023685D00|nr:MULTISPECIES: sugar phosphate isomerase/epimerase family protein [unclassified Paenibacillus]